MAKKSKKQTRKVSGVNSTASVETAPVRDESAAAVSSRAYYSDFNPDYSQTIKDLRRIGVLAGTFFAILIIISFFLR